MNLKRVRVDPDGLIIQTAKGTLKRIPLTENEVDKFINNPTAGLSDLVETDEFVKNFLDTGEPTYKIDIIDEKVGFMNRPLRIYYGIEPRCNLVCKFCGPRDFHEDFATSTLETEDFILRQIAEAKTFQVQLTGGEIGIRGKNLLNTIKKIADLGMAVIISTNGVWRCSDNKEDFFKGLAECGNIIQSKISIEGDKEFHESIRGKGTYNDTIDTLKKLSENGLNPRINTTIFKSSCNKKQLNHLVNLARQYRAGFQPIPVRLAGRAKELKAEIPDKAQLKEYTQEATRLRQKYNLPITFNFDIYEPGRQVPIYDLHVPVSCGAPLMGVHITHTGECYPCGFAQEIPEFMVGQITKNRSLVDIWLNSEDLKKFRNTGKSLECKACSDYGKGCWGGCWVMGWVATGKINGLDPYCLKY